MKRTIALILAMLLCFAALGETALDCAAGAGYTPEEKAVSTAVRACHFEEQDGRCAVVWTGGGRQYSIVEERDPERLRALYLRLLSAEAWEQCMYVANGKRLYGYNAARQVLNACGTLEDYAAAVYAAVYGIVPTPKPTPRPTTAAAPRPTDTPKPRAGGTTFVLNTNTRKFHLPDCKHVSEILEKNRQDVTWSRQAVVDAGYTPCKSCQP